MIFVDTNYFLRLILKDVDHQYKIAKPFFEKASKEDTLLTTSTLVFFEIFFILKNTYKKSKAEIIKILRNIINMSFLYLEEKHILINALKLYETSTVELQDCYNVAYCRDKDIEDFKTFDQKLQKVIK